MKTHILEEIYLITVQLRDVNMKQAQREADQEQLEQTRTIFLNLVNLIPTNI